MGISWSSIYIGGLYSSIRHKHIFFPKTSSSVCPVLLTIVHKWLADYVFKQKSKYD